MRGKDWDGGELNMEKKLYRETERIMEKILEASSKTIGNLRAGRASISL